MAGRKALALWKLYGGLCGICGEPIDLKARNQKALTIDEILPRSKGGAKVIANQQPAHRGCNTRKGSKQLMPVLYPPRGEELPEVTTGEYQMVRRRRKIGGFNPIAMRCPCCSESMESNGDIIRCARRACRFLF